MNDQGHVFDLYDKLIAAWNERNAEAFAGLFQGKGEMVDSDGSRVVGRKEIGTHLRASFSQSPVPPYVAAPQRLHSIKSGVLLLAAKAGIKTDQSGDFNPELWSEQSVVAVKTKEGWKVALFQNTPAALSSDAERLKTFVKEFRQARADRTATAR